VSLNLRLAVLSLLAAGFPLTPVTQPSSQLRHLSFYLDMDCTHWLFFQHAPPNKFRCYRIDGIALPLRGSVGSSGSMAGSVGRVAGASVARELRLFEVGNRRHSVDVAWRGGWRASDFVLHIGDCCVTRALCSHRTMINSDGSSCKMPHTQAFPMRVCVCVCAGLHACIDDVVAQASRCQGHTS